MTKTAARIRTAARRNLSRSIDRSGNANLTQMAEETSLDLNHPEWCDDPDHEVWEIVMEIAERAGALR